MFACRSRFGLSLIIVVLAAFGCGRTDMNGRAGKQTPAEETDAHPTSNDASPDQRREDLKPQEISPDAAGDTALEARGQADASQDIADPRRDAIDRDRGLDEAREAGTRDTVPTLSLLAGTIGGAGSLDGIGPAARFCLPTGMANDGKGNLFVSDKGSHVIRKVVLATGEVTTFAGRSSHPGAVDGLVADARFSSPHGLASDGAGHLLVADSGNHAVRRIDLATGKVTTLAGSADRPGVADGVGATASFQVPAGVAADGAGSVYVTDQDSHTIRRITLADGQVTTLAGQAGTRGDSDGVGLAARFYSPEGIVVDGSGKLFVADAGNGRIRAVTLATAKVTTLDSDISTHPTGMALDGEGRLYFTDAYDNVLRVLDIASGAVSLLAGKLHEPGHRDGTGPDALFSFPSETALDGKGHVLVADQGTHTIRQITIATGVVTTFAGKALETGNVDGVGERARFSSESAMVSDGQGNLFVADTLNRIIRRVEMATGRVSTLAGSGGRSGSSDGIGAAASFAKPAGITRDGAGNLFVTDSDDHTVRRIVVATAEVATWVGAPGMKDSVDGVGENARFSLPQGIAADDAGNLYVSDAGTTIRKIVISTRTVTTLAGLAWQPGHEDGVGPQARFSYPRGLAWDARSLFVADLGNHTIRRVSTVDGTVTTVAGSPGEAGSVDGTGPQARFGSPNGMALDHSGHLFVADGYTIRKLTISTGAVTTAVGSRDQFGSRLGPLPASLGFSSALVFVEPGTLFLSVAGAILRADL